MATQTATRYGVSFEIVSNGKRLYGTATVVDGFTTTDDIPRIIAAGRGMLASEIKVTNVEKI